MRVPMMVREVTDSEDEAENADGYPQVAWDVSLIDLAARSPKSPPPA